MATPNECLNIVLIGDTVAGRHQIGLSFTEEELDAYLYNDMPSKHIEVDGREIRVEICDTIGLEQFPAMRDLYIRKAMGMMLVYDITDRRTFTGIDDYYRQTKLIRTHVGDLQTILVGNNCDPEHKREVGEEEGRKLAKSLGIKFMEVSAKERINIDEAFVTLTEDILANTEKRVTRNKKASIFKRLLQPVFGGKTKTATSVPEEIQQDPHALDLYERILREGSEMDRSIRINIVGNYRQGKTSLMKRLLGQKVTDVSSTDGIDIMHYKCHRTVDGKCSLKKVKENEKTDIVNRLVSVTLTSKHDQHRQVSDTAHTEICQIEHTLNMAHDKVLSEPESRVQKMKRSPPMVLASSSDFEVPACLESKAKQTMLSKKEKETFARKLSENKSQTTIKETKTNFDIWDFGGQHIFYATHTLFHSKNAIYLLVFDLSLDLRSVIVDEDFPEEEEESDDKDMEYFLHFWMNSIHSFAGSEDGTKPTVILVGTHKDKVKGNVQVKSQYIEHYFDKIRTSFDETKLLNHVYFEDFAVDNTLENDETVLALRETIMTLGDAQSKTIQIPAKWIQLEKSLNTRVNLKIIPFELVLAIDEEHDVPIGDPEQIKLFLRYHHSKGTYIYFDEEPLSDHVVLEPQYLIDAFKCIITAERFCTNDPEIRPFWKMLQRDGRLDEALINKQWGKDDSKMFMQHKEILISFLTKHHIISEATSFDETTKNLLRLGWFVVPSLLKAHLPRMQVQQFLRGRKQTVVRFVMLFDNSTVVPTIYHRLMAAIIGRWAIAHLGKTTLVSNDKCVVRLNMDHAGIAEMRFDTIELTVVSLCPSSSVLSKQADIFRRFSEAVISHEFSKLERKRGDQTKPYSTKFRCNSEIHDGIGSVNVVDIDTADDESLIPCPDLYSHEIDVKKSRAEWFQDNSEKISVSNAKLNDQILSKISGCIGKNWQLLGLELGVGQVDIEQISEDNPHSTAMRIYYMLKTWYRQMADSANMNVLVQKMQECPNVTIQWDKIRNVIDEMIDQ